MEKPEYKLDFEVEACFDVKDDVKIKLLDRTKIILYQTEGVNKGSVIFQTENMNFGEVKEEGRLRADSFLNFLVVLLNIENLPSTKFAESPELLNSEKFKGVRLTIEKQFTANACLKAVFQDKWAEQAKNLIERASKLNNLGQNALDYCLYWLRKGAEAKGNDRFIYRWISLEALCGILGESTNSIKSTEALINELISKLKSSSSKDICERHKETINKLAEANLEGRDGAKRSRNLKRTIDTCAGCTAILQKTALCIYEVRNRLIHRGEAVAIIDGCSALLSNIVSATIKDLL